MRLRIPFVAVVVYTAMQTTCQHAHFFDLAVRPVTIVHAAYRMIA